MTKTKTVKKKSLFDHLTAITQIQDPDYFNKISVDDKKTWSNFMLLRFLSMNEKLHPIVTDLQPLVQELEPELFYKTFIGIIPRGRYYSKYIKGDNDERFEKWLLELIALEFQVSQTEADDYLDILRASTEGLETIEHICEKYGTEPSKIKKTIKLIKNLFKKK